MKKCFLYLAGLLVLLAYSCTDEQLVEQTGNKLRITGSLASDSRTTFVEGEGVIETHWNIDDEIGLLTEKQTNLPYKSLEKGKFTEFSKLYYSSEELNPEEGMMVYAYYPYSYSEGIDAIGLPRTYVYSGGEPIVPFLYAQSTIKNGELNFQFKHLFAYLKLIISTKEIKERLELAEYNGTNEYGNIKISSTENISILHFGRPEVLYNLKTNEIYSTSDWALNNYIDLYYNEYMDMNIDSTYTFIIPILPQSKGTTLTASIRAGEDSYSIVFLDAITKTVPESGLQAGHVYTWDIAEPFQYEENVNLLKSFYDKTGGDQWAHNDNWLSGESLSQWYGINEHKLSNNIEKLKLNSNNLTGSFPEEVAEIMSQINLSLSLYPGDNCLDLNYNNLYGPIPDAVRNHKRWNELGWGCVEQNYDTKDELDLTNSNLYVENVRVEDLFGDESTVQYLYDIFKQNKLTQITGCDFSTKEKTTIDGVLGNFIDGRVNQHMDYHGKGLHTIFFLGNTGTKDEENELKNSLHGIYGEVDGITWLKGCNNNTSQYRSASYFYDSNGQLVYVAHHNPTCPGWPDELLIEKTDRFLRSTLGEPEEHPEFTAEIYTSTDYSRDGEVVSLQAATVGKGINLVFLGEAFVDKDMEPGGLYEQTMREAMEQFFSYEPYKSFRNRFNVYAVKSVSPNSTFMKESKHAINENLSVCFNYVQKIPNAGLNPPMVSVIYRDHTWNSATFGRSYCVMYTDGSFASFIIESLGNDGSVLMHESGGHGFSKLLDEYVEYGNEELELPEEKRSLLDNGWLQYGRGANVDWRSDASTVKWSHFLNDERYENEGLGLYEGAYLYGYGAYRPSENSMMRYNDSPFNAPSREQIYKRIMQLSEGADWKYNYEDFVKYDEINRKSATRSAIRPLSEAEKKEYAKKHCPPTFIKGTWRDAMKNGKSNSVIPLR